MRVTRFDRYILSQLMVVFGFFSLVLVSVYWVNRAVSLFDRLIAGGHSLGVFVEFSLLSLPNVIRIILPVAAFAASVYVTNKLTNDSELTVMQATGFTPWRIARPVLMFGVIVMVMVGTLANILVPRSTETFDRRNKEISSSISARLLREGAFVHPMRGVTFYVKDISDTGELSSVFISDRRDPMKTATYSAEQAYIVNVGDQSTIVMFNGTAQTLDQDERSLNVARFDDLSFDIGSLIVRDPTLRPNIEYMPTFDLIFDPTSAQEQTGASLSMIAKEGHGRIQQALLCVVVAFVGFAALLIGNFSRFGIGRQIIGAIAILVSIKFVESTMISFVQGNAALWPLLYAPTLYGAVICALLLSRTGRPLWLPRRKAQRAS